MKYQHLLALIVLTCLIACKEKESRSEEVTNEVTTYYLIRHAEKDRSNPEEKDPELTEKGLLRAAAWAEVFKNVDLNAVYSTDYRRTRQTTQPTADAKNLNLITYDPKNLDISLLKAEHRGGNVLIVGHSNTTPMLVNKLLGTSKYPDIDDAENGCLFIVTISGSQISDQLLIIN